MHDKDYLEKTILDQTKLLKQTFEAQRMMKAMGNEGMARLRAKEQLEIKSNIERLQSDLDALKE